MKLFHPYAEAHGWGDAGKFEGTSKIGAQVITAKKQLPTKVIPTANGNPNCNDDVCVTVNKYREASYKKKFNKRRR